VDRSRVLTFGSIRDEAETLTGDEPVDEIKRRFDANAKLKGMFVVDNNKPVGLIDRERIAEAEDGATARSLMDRHFAKVRRSTFICESFDRLGDHKLFAVVDREGKLRGTVDPMDVFRHLEPPTEEEAISPGGRPGEHPDDVEPAAEPVAQETA
jgi:Mg/Co/Ni transporter MgtE